MRKKDHDKSELGLTLIEILASIVIIVIIMAIGLGILVQTAKTNKTSEEIVDATYVAQTEMEKIYHASISSEVDMISWFEAAYGSPQPVENWHVFTKEKGDYRVHVKVQQAASSEELNRAVVQVFEKNDPTKVKAQMENHFKWEGQN